MKNQLYDKLLAKKATWDSLWEKREQVSRERNEVYARYKELDKELLALCEKSDKAHGEYCKVKKAYETLEKSNYATENILPMLDEYLNEVLSAGHNKAKVIEKWERKGIAWSLVEVVLGDD